jgi:hypothetical protein
MAAASASGVGATLRPVIRSATNSLTPPASVVVNTGFPDCIASMVISP